ncbi:MAG TPA: class I SAM-dependent methyltransferase [Candidatus Angelobacter sp.]|nr:class I SAM-dependent methyltransferase [Candidatus Angelobacter sp.]
MAHHSGNSLVGSSSLFPWTAAGLLELLASGLEGCPNLELEFSLRLGGGNLQSAGRFACWVNGKSAEDFAPLRRVLDCMGAPASMLAAQQNHQLAVRQAIAVAVDPDHAGAGTEFKLYLHGRDPVTLADRYHAWRWRPGSAPRTSEYVFHFMPETPSGVRPIQFVSEELRPAFARLLECPRLLQMSGFWLRYGEHGKIDQFDIALPWHPQAGSVQGLPELVQALGVPETAFAFWRELPIRHIATSVGAVSPLVTLYASASLIGSFPPTEEALQACVRESSRITQRAIEEEILQPVELLGPQESQPDLGTFRDLGSFYDGPIETWEAVLGPEMHYHAGIFESSYMNSSDEAMARAQRRAVTDLYPFLPAGGRIYDIGCGWGGPLEMFIRDLGCPSLGLTISRRQFEHVAACRLPVRWGDAETTLPPGQFDAIVLLESLSHIRDKERLLKLLRLFTRRLVMRVNCQDSLPPGTTFGGSMHMISSTRLHEMLEAAGWNIIHWRDRRREAVPSVAVWHRRLQSLPPAGDRHLEVFRAWCERVMTFSHDWATHNPLIEVVAERG